MFVEQFDFVLCRFSKFLVNADTQVESLVGHELLGLNLILVAECQRVLAFVLGDKFAYDCQLSVLVFLSENVEFANFERWLQANNLLLITIPSLAFLGEGIKELLLLFFRGKAKFTKVFLKETSSISHV